MKKKQKPIIENYVSPTEEYSREDFVRIKKKFHNLFEGNKIEMPKYFLQLSNDIKYIEKVDNVFMQAKLYIYEKLTIKELKTKFSKDIKPKTGKSIKWINIISTPIRN